MVEFLTDEHGFKYFLGLHKDAIPASIHHFHVGGIKKIDMPYLLQSGAFPALYELNYVNEMTQSKNLVPYIETKQLYVFKQDILDLTLFG
jgi:hypothetical protein